MNHTAAASAIRSKAASFLIGGGEMAGLINAYDWSSTPPGPLETWPQSLKTATASPVPIVEVIGFGNVTVVPALSHARISSLLK